MRTESEIRQAIKDLYDTLCEAKTFGMPLNLLEMIANTIQGMKWAVGEGDDVQLWLDKLRNRKVGLEIM